MYHIYGAIYRPTINENAASPPSICARATIRFSYSTPVRPFLMKNDTECGQQHAILSSPRGYFLHRCNIVEFYLFSPNFLFLTGPFPGHIPLCHCTPIRKPQPHTHERVWKNLVERKTEEGKKDANIIIIPAAWKRINLKKSSRRPSPSHFIVVDLLPWILARQPHT